MDDLAEKLQGVAERWFPGFTRMGEVRRLTAGATQEIWRFEIVCGEVATPLILRRAPGGERVSATAVGLETEALLLGLAGAAGAPAPGVRHVLRPEDGLGHGFIMEFIEGETLGGRVVRSPELADVRPRLARQCGEILARIHSIDPAAVPMLKRSSPTEQVNQWRASYQATNWPRPVFELAFRWLDDHCPPDPAEPKLVHGDFRNGNLIFGPDGVRAVLDWELAHVGDPMTDLGWICTCPWRFGGDKPVGGFGEREDLFAGYEAAGGGRVDRAHVRFWEVFGSLKWGVICAGMTAAFRGADPSVERAVIARRASENEVDLMRLLAS